MSDSLDGEITSDAVFRALADARRRWVLAYLRASEGAVSVPTLAGAVLSRVEAAGDGSEQRLAAALYHVHIPKLTAAGLVEWVGDRRAVRTTAAGESLPAAVRWLPAEAAPLD